VSNNTNVKQLGGAISSIAGLIDINNSAGAAGEQNEIGVSKLIDNFTEFGTEPFQKEGDTWDPERQIFTRGGMTISASEKTYTFHGGTMVEDIIQQIVLISKFGQTLPDIKADQAGMFRWFRIQVKTEIISMSEEANLGRTALRYIYEVYPYFVHQSVLSMPSDSNNANVLVDDAVKAFNYMYTGLNRDILDFEIDLNNAAILMANLVDDGQRNPTALGTVGSTVVATNNSVYARKVAGSSGGGADSGQAANNSNAFQEFVDEASLAIAELRNILGVFGGAGIDNNRTRVAQLFKQAIEDKSTLVTLKLTILGDPYYIGDSGMGNYHAGGSGYINGDGAMPWDKGEIHVIVNFKTPVDFNSDTGLYDFGNTITATQFSGLYRVLKGDSNFQKGKFTQTLTLVRLRNQDSPGGDGKLSVQPRDTEQTEFGDYGMGGP
jgi:predicted transcriptional regulator with HTH domain